MRNNQPVSQHQYTFAPHQTLVSVTDLKGRITYCNAAFCEVSGFARAELLGQPHNLVRHPDMPEEAFRDMWATIQSGLPWTGLVKNRRSDGDHYWVRANATPMKDGDRITGFLSVRTCPGRDEVQAAEALYARMREEAQTGRVVLALRRGKVVRVDLWGRIGSRLRPGPAARLAGIHVAAGAAVAGAAIVSPLAAAMVAVPAAALGAWFSWRWFVAPLRGVLADAYQLASGNLAHEVGDGAPGVAGELQQALTQLSVNLRTVVSDARSEAHNTNLAASEIAAGNSDLSSRTESQASSLEETAASMEQINSTVRQSAEAASQGARLASEAAEVAQRSHGAVQAVAETMTSITESSQRIQEIVAVVEGVAFQTNLLALNAAVEAARAGESGRGFAVVASEVRGLAQRTSSAAGEIKRLINESSARVADGVAKAAEARARMSEALTSVSNVNGMFDGIRTAALEQQRGIAQINEAVSQIDSITQQNAAMVEQLSASAHSLRGQVESVSNSMRMFRLTAGEITVAEVDAVELRRQAASKADAHTRH